ncbi:MAG: dihydropteroate synthase [Phycisphaerae bacterium]
MPTRSIQPQNRPERTFRTAHGDLIFGRRCLVMGVLNVTPDSFSDGGRYRDREAAVRAAQRMAAAGADVIDVGGESTRPGARGVPVAAQIERVVPVIQALRAGGCGVPVSIDTRSARVADAALAVGADIVNDVSGARHDSDMPRLLADRGVPFVVMHMRGTPETMQADPHYEDVVAEVGAFFEQRAEALEAMGVEVDARMIVDPGIGFGKRLEHNLALLRAAASFGERWPVLVGASRKRFLGELLDEPVAKRRVMGTAAAVAHAALTGVDMVRVHDVRPMRQVVDVCERIAFDRAADGPAGLRPRPETGPPVSRRC